MRTYLALPTEYHNTLNEKLLEEKVEDTFHTRTVCGRLHHDTEAFDQICDSDALVILHGSITPQVIWCIKIAYCLHKEIYTWNGVQFTRITEVRFAPPKGGDLSKRV